MKGRVVGDWTFGELLGHGGQGAVYRGEHRLLKTSFAIKVVNINSESSDRWSFSREAEIAASLAHPNITRAYLPFEIEGEDTLCLPMELLTGEPLSDRIRREKREPWDVADAILVAIQTCEALAFAHRAGIVHRDIKPSNLFLTTNGDVKVLDFGLARSAEATQTDHKGVKGTLPFFAPELLQGEPPSAASDVYGLGAVLYRLLTGQLPVQINPAAPVDQQLRAIVDAHRDGIPLAHEQVASIPPEVSELVATLLASDPDARPLNGQGALAFLRPFAPSSEDKTHGVELPESIRRRPSVLEEAGPTLTAPAAATATDVDEVDALRPAGGGSTLPSFTFGSQDHDETVRGLSNEEIEPKTKQPDVEEANAADTLEAQPEDDDAGVEHTRPVDLRETLARIAEMEGGGDAVVANEARESEAIVELPDQTIKQDPIDPASLDLLRAVQEDPSGSGVDVRQFKSKAPLYAAVVGFGLLVGGVGWALLPSDNPPQEIRVRPPTPRSEVAAVNSAAAPTPVAAAPKPVKEAPPARAEPVAKPAPAAAPSKEASPKAAKATATRSSKRARRARRRREARKASAAAQRQLLLGNLDPAEKSLQKCLQLDSSVASCHRMLGVYYARMRKHDKSVASYKRYLQLAPKAADAQTIRDIIKRAGG